jgi:hypothetical protein
MESMAFIGPKKSAVNKDSPYLRMIQYVGTLYLKVL